MRAVRLHQYGQAPTIDEVAEPRPLGPWDVVIDVGAAGLCRRTCWRAIISLWAVL